jgi:hypothetical protein
LIRVSQWAEIRQMHLVEGVAKREIARCLGLDIKTVRRALPAPDRTRMRRGSSGVRGSLISVRVRSARACCPSTPPSRSST